jgi:uncharacterized SAM-binding protein YcdF (DUF218 family)
MGTREGRARAATGLAIGALAGLLAHALDVRALVSFWHDDLVLVPLSAVLGAWLWPTRARAAVAATTLALGAVWLTVAFSPLSRWMAQGLVRRDIPRAADAVFVLSSDMQRDGDPTSVAEARLVRALELVGQRQAGTLVLSDTYSARGSYTIVARQLLAHLNLSPELVVVGPVGNTRDEAVAMAALAHARGWHTLLLVTSPTHSRRASAAFERVGLTVVSSPCPETRYDLESLNRPGDRLAAFGPVMHERLGLWVYARRGWI